MVELIHNTTELKNRKPTDFAVREEPRHILLCSPTYFDVVDVKNVHMEGQFGKIDKAQASLQWEEMKRTIELDSNVHTHCLEPIRALEDMVFTANPVLPGLDSDGKKIALLSNMQHSSRQKEVVAYEKWFSTQGYDIKRLSNRQWNFEGQGDALWHPGRRLLWGGYGFRTNPHVYWEISRLFSAPALLLELTREHFYHLDTCLCPLSENEALFFPGAFTKNGTELIRALFQDAVEVDEKEAKEGFACNALVLEKRVLIQRGNSKTNQALIKRGYEVVELDTSEYMKSGGSVFCMKMMVY